MRKSVVLYLNGKRHELQGEEAFMTVSDWLRYQKGLTGTKVVCAEGDCGACTVLVSRLVGKRLSPYHAVNSCISFMYLLDRSHLITVEGLKNNETLHPVQKAMLEANGAQCGYCTPGFICSMASLAEDAKVQNFSLEEKRVKNYLTGNLCRCTGYEAIIKAGCSVDLSQTPKLCKLYDDVKIESDFITLDGQSLELQYEDKTAFIPATLNEALSIRAAHPQARLTSGATDLGVLSNKGKAKLVETLSLNALSELYSVKEDSGFVTIGAKASFAEVENATVKIFPDFSELLHVFASPQIKNSGTLVGNLVNASPIGDTIPFLRVAEAEVVLMSIRGERKVNINFFIKGGYKQLDLAADEIVAFVKIPKTKHHYKLYKVSNRKDLDISSVTFAARYEIANGVLLSFSLAVGGVGPTVLRMNGIEQKAVGQKLSPALFKDLANDLNQQVKPLSDVRGSADFRHVLCQNLMLKFGDEVMRENGVILSEASL